MSSRFVYADSSINEAKLDSVEGDLLRSSLKHLRYSSLPFSHFE